MADLSTKIGRTDFTLEFVAESLDGKDPEWNRLRILSRLKDAKITAVSGNGYLSLVHRVVFFFDSVTYSVILKVTRRRFALVKTKGSTAFLLGALCGSVQRSAMKSRR